MATNKNPKESSSFGSTIFKKLSLNDANRPNLESFACLWLDQNVHLTEDNRETLGQLRQVINHLQTFDNSERCEQYIRQITYERIILIVSGTLGQQIVPRLHSLPQLSACYIFCQNKISNEQWANKYYKIKGVFILRSALVDAIAKDQIDRDRINDGTSMYFINRASKTREAQNASFLWFQLFIEALLRLDHRSTDRKELIEICKQSCEGNSIQMKIINEFEKNYTATDAIKWYTRETCFYRIMNKALRKQDYEMLLILAFFITDIAKTVKDEYQTFIRTNHSREIIRVYRGQAIEMKELDLMRNSVGEFLSMNAFLSTSFDRLVAIDYARKGSDEFHLPPILFEIEINPEFQTKAFADVSRLSSFQKEGEVLIILGALFRVDKIIEDKKNHLWIARISLAKEDDYHLKETFTYMKDKMGQNTNLDSIGKILIELGQHQLARKCYIRMMEESQLTYADAQAGLGWTDFDCRNFDQSLDHHRQALKIRRQFLGDSAIEVGNSYRQIASVHLRQGNYDEALVCSMKSIRILENTNPIDPVVLARTYSNIAVTYNHLEKTNMALEYYNKAVKVQEKYLPTAHPDIARTLCSIGCLYRDIGQCLKALEYLEKSLDISRKTLPPTHQDITRTENYITKIKKKLNQ